MSVNMCVYMPQFVAGSVDTILNGHSKQQHMKKKGTTTKGIKSCQRQITSDDLMNADFRNKLEHLLSKNLGSFLTPLTSVTIEKDFPM